MKENNQEQRDLQLTNAIKIGLETLSDPEIRVRARDTEDLANLKDILRGLLNGNLVLATPDRLLPVDAQLPNQETPEE